MIPLGAMALLAFLATHGEAAADNGKRLAYSQRLGVEVLAIGGPDWCQERTSVQILADSKDLFARPDFESLIRTLGAKVLVNDCPATKTLIISGIEKATGSVVWSGKADSGSWKPVATADAPASPSPSPAGEREGESGAKTADAPSLPVPTSPLGGEWAAEADCKDWNASNKNQIALSVYEVSGSRFKAVWNRRYQDGVIDRFYVDGIIDDLTNQIKIIASQKGAIRAGRLNQFDLLGTFNAKSGQVTVIGLCSAQRNVTMNHASPIPLTAHRALADAARRKIWEEEERHRQRDYRIVGRLPPGVFRKPSCADLVAWANSYPSDQRIRLFPASDGVLRHYDDATTQRVFGSPAYYWLGWGEVEGRTRVALDKIAYEVCGNNRYTDSSMNAVRDVIRDYASQQEMERRYRYDEELARIPPYLATLGDEPADAVAGLNRFATMAGIQENIRQFKLDPNVLSAEETTGLIKDVVRYKVRLAEAASAAKALEIAAVPTGLGSLDQLAKIKSGFVALFGEPASVTVVKAVDERRQEIARALVDKATAELGTTPRTFDGMMDVDLKVSELRDKLGGDPGLEAPLRDLTTSESRFRQDARETVVRAELEAVAAAPATQEGALALVAREKVIRKALGNEAGPSFTAYQKAVAAKVAEVGATMLPVVKAELAALPARWSSLDAARKIAAAKAAPMAGTPAQAAIAKEGEARVQAILAELADQAILDVKGTTGNGLKGIGAALEEASRAAQPFATVDGGGPQAERVKEAGRKRANEIAEAYLPEFRLEVKNAPVSRLTAIQMAAASVYLDRSVKEIQALGKLRDAARDGAIAMYAGVCDKALGEAGIGGSDGRLEVLVGPEIGTLKRFVCDLREGGMRSVKFETPGLMKAIAGGEKEYVLRLFATDAVLQRALGQGFIGRESLDDATRFQSAEELFDFGGGRAGARPSEKSDVESPAKIVFKEMEVRQDRKALVGVQFGDDAKTESLSLRGWRELSARLAAMSGGEMDHAQLCVAGKKDGGREMTLYAAGLALLTCGSKN